MSGKSDLREKVISQPSYWIEGVNAFLYDAILCYMEEHNLKRKDLAKHLEISPGRVSQILNDGEINFSLEKIINIALKVDKIPDFKFEGKKAFLLREQKHSNVKKLFFRYNINQLSDLEAAVKGYKTGKVISLDKHNEERLELPFKLHG